MSLRIYKIATIFTIVGDSLLVFIYYITISLSTLLPPFFWYDGIPSGMLGGLWSLKRTVIKPPKRWLQVDSWWIVPKCLFPSTHARVRRHTHTRIRASNNAAPCPVGLVPIATRCWDYPLFLIFTFILFLYTSNNSLMEEQCSIMTLILIKSLEDSTTKERSICNGAHLYKISVWPVEGCLYHTKD